MLEPIAVSRETQERLDSFLRLLGRWGSTLNLVSKADLATGLAARHLRESLSLIEYLPPGISRIVDLGSGGGFPAIPLAISTGLHIDMIEADLRKAAFLENALATLGLPGTVWPDRIETTLAPQAQCVTARALAPLPTLLGYVHRLLSPGGVALLLKGERAEAEIAAARPSWRMNVEIFAPGGDNNRPRLLKVSGLEPAA